MILDLNRQYKMIGPADEQGESWALQDGMIFSWSESNGRFEQAWWLNSNGTPRTDHPNPGHIQGICRQRPFDPEWLKEHPGLHHPSCTCLAMPGDDDCKVHGR